MKLFVKKYFFILAGKKLIVSEPSPLVCNTVVIFTVNTERPSVEISPAACPVGRAVET